MMHANSVKVVLACKLGQEFSIQMLACNCYAQYNTDVILVFPPGKVTLGKVPPFRKSPLPRKSPPSGEVLFEKKFEFIIFFKSGRFYCLYAVDH